MTYLIKKQEHTESIHQIQRRPCILSVFKNSTRKPHLSGDLALRHADLPLVHFGRVPPQTLHSRPRGGRAGRGSPALRVPAGIGKKRSNLRNAMFETVELFYGRSPRSLWSNIFSDWDCREKPRCRWRNNPFGVAIKRFEDQPGSIANLNIIYIYIFSNF